MARTDLALPVPPDADDLGEAFAQMFLIGGAPKRLAEYMVSRMGPPPVARLSLRDEALLALATCCPAPSDRKRAEAMAGKLSRYQAGRWRIDRAYATAPPKYGDEDRALFAVLKASPASGAPRVTTIRDALASARMLVRTID